LKAALAIVRSLLASPSSGCPNKPHADGRTMAAAARHDIAANLKSASRLRGQFPFSLAGFGPR
jgi:hypothetical protein